MALPVHVQYLNTTAFLHENLCFDTRSQTLWCNAIQKADTLTTDLATGMRCDWRILHQMPTKPASYLLCFSRPIVATGNWSLTSGYPGFHELAISYSKAQLRQLFLMRQ